MALKYAFIAYSLFAVITECFQIADTISQERKSIRNGDGLLGDSTYYVLLLNILFKIIIGFAGVYFFGSIQLPVNNDLALVGLLALLFIALELISATLQAIVITVISRIGVKRGMKRLEEAQRKSKE